MSRPCPPIARRLRAALLMLPMLSGCADDATPSCSEAIDNAYGYGCALVYAGDPLSRGEAVSGCRDWDRMASDCGCVSQHEAARVCLAALSSPACSSCDAKLGALWGCLANC